MLPFEDQIGRLAERHGTVVYLVLLSLVALMVLWAVTTFKSEPHFSGEVRRKLKEETVRLMRGEYRGLKGDAIALRLGVKARDLRPLLAELVEDRFLLTEGDEKDPLYRLRGLDNY